MMASSTVTPRAFAVWWKDVDRWSVNSFRASSWQWPPHVIKKLAFALKRRCEPVDKATFDLRPEHFVKLPFTGEIEPRDLHGKVEFKGNLFFAQSGDIIYSKIDVRNGAIGIVPEKFPVITVTTEFPVYQIKNDAALSEYIQLVFRTEHFRRIINGMVSGTSGRKRVQPDDIENVEIPLPTLEVQKAIVNLWLNAQVEIAKIRTKINEIESQLEQVFLDEIGIKVHAAKPRRGAFAIEWKNVERWDTFFYRNDFIDLEKMFLRIKHIPLGTAVRFISRNWKPSDFPNGFFEYIEISAVTKNEGIIGSRRVDIENAPSRATTLLKEGDIIISTTRPYLGAFAVVPAQYDGCVCSSGFALADSVAHNDLDKDFLLFFLKTSAGLRQMERRMTGGLYPAIVQPELEKVKIPIPSLKMQKEIMKRMAAGRIEIIRKREAVDRKTNEINAEIEALILGSKALREK